MALGERAGRVRGRVDEDVPVVERGDQPDVLGQQHAVAEHVAGHVADADDGELLRLGVHAQLAEVPLHRLPGAAGGDAHALVVVADRAAGGERVAQPEAVGVGHVVRDVGERGGALVGRDHQVLVVAVVADHVVRRHDLALDQVVGDVQQPGDERAVAGDPLGLERLPVTAGRRLLHHEATLGADRHDHRVLHHLGLDQAQHLGAEVLAPVGPAQPAAGHLAEPQVHALHPGRVDEDLELRPRHRQLGHGLRVDLERQVRLVPAVRAALEVVGAQGGQHEGEEAAQDPVLVQAGDVVQGRGDLGHQLVRPGLPHAGAGREAGVEPGREQVDDLPGQLGVGREGALHVVLAVDRAGLPQVLGVGAEHHDLVPVQARPRSTRALKPSTSDSPRQAAANAFSIAPCTLSSCASPRRASGAVRPKS